MISSNFAGLGEQARQRRRRAVGIDAAIGVDVLADQRDLDDAVAHKRADIVQYLADGPRNFGAARIGHDAKTAEFVAAFLRRDKGGGPTRARRRRPRRGQEIELVLGGKIDVDLRPPARLGQQFGQAMVALRPDDEIDGLLPLQDRRALGLRDATGDDEHGVLPERPSLVLQFAQLSELGKNLLGGLFADMAGVENDEVGFLNALGRFVPLRLGDIAHALRVDHVHLTAE